ncbi:peptidylprolyl cis-trans isomerase [Plesiocystis pacifica SIR-1]|uniref:Periplasmic chaperone PpiD n=1 Tax=Plesiocystis pacifica SIR-1 TaxID=391625 RepID=A6GK32_9BACT|nr:peptidylprolyl isomerase [Plesiocystis pacifica]EDM73776.1 peptidylprolyl cis-trans isomerase [Plesiocystis pacifica SIR-1]
MFGSERGKGGDIVVWLILGVLALAFGLTFGLPSDQLSVGESGYARVFGQNVTKEDFAYQQRALGTVFPLPEGEQGRTFGVREEVLEAIVERLVLASTGEELGLMTETRDAEEMTRDGFYIILDLDRGFPWAGEAKFDYEWFKNDFLRGYLVVSEPRYLEIQRQELLARQTRDLIAASVVVPEAEVWAEFEKRNNQLSLRYVRFPPNDYAELVDPTAAEVDGWMMEHPDELTEMYEREAARFLKLPAEVDLRIIEVAKPMQPPADAGEEVQAMWEANVAAAKAKAELARTRIVDNGERFSTVARELSEAIDTARIGGRYGWTQVTDTGSGLDRAVDKAAQALEDGQVSEVIEGESALFVVMVAGHREGDVPEDQAKRELAEDAVRSARGRELAKQAADEALLALREGGKDLDDLFGAKTPELGKPGALGGLGGGGGLEDAPLGEGAGEEEGAGEGEEGAPAEAPAVAKNVDFSPKIEIKETGLFQFGEAIPDIGANPGLTLAAWEVNMDEPVIDEVFNTPAGYLVAVVDERSQADRERYAEERAEIYDRLTRTRAIGVLSAFTKHRCYLGKATVDIRTNDRAVDQLMAYEGVEWPEENAPLPPYEMCARVGDGGGMLRLAGALRGQGMRSP